MVHLSIRNIQATNMIFSSWALVFLAVGIIIEEWAELTFEPKQHKLIHNPWICCNPIWPEGRLEVIRNLLILVLNLSFFHNLLLGFEFTYMIPQTKLILFMTAFLAVLTGILLFCALILYQQKLKEGESMYYSSYRITWIIFINYINVFFLIVSGYLSFLQYRHSIDSCVCPANTPKSARESQVVEPSGTSIKVISLPESGEMPRSIVRVHSAHMKEASPNKAQIQLRRVTWAV
uniref:Transmembrane protein 225 domain-containing protein n=1 Tax=Catagonus wagneri TaxID=51154 RepID=A0A8C3VRA8_9CETA